MLKQDVPCRPPINWNHTSKSPNVRKDAAKTPANSSMDNAIAFFLLMLPRQVAPTPVRGRPRHHSRPIPAMRDLTPRSAPSTSFPPLIFFLETIPYNRIDKNATLDGGPKHEPNGRHFPENKPHPI